MLQSPHADKLSVGQSNIAQTASRSASAPSPPPRPPRHLRRPVPAPSLQSYKSCHPEDALKTNPISSPPQSDSSHRLAASTRHHPTKIEHPSSPASLTPSLSLGDSQASTGSKFLALPVIPHDALDISQNGGIDFPKDAYIHLPSSPTADGGTSRLSRSSEVSESNPSMLSWDIYRTEEGSTSGVFDLEVELEMPELSASQATTYTAPFLETPPDVAMAPDKGSHRKAAFEPSTPSLDEERNGRLNHPTPNIPDDQNGRQHLSPISSPWPAVRPKLRRVLASVEADLGADTCTTDAQLRSPRPPFSPSHTPHQPSLDLRDEVLNIAAEQEETLRRISIPRVPFNFPVPSIHRAKKKNVATIMPNSAGVSGRSGRSADNDTTDGFYQSDALGAGKEGLILASTGELEWARSTDITSKPLL